MTEIIKISTINPSKTFNHTAIPKLMVTDDSAVVDYMKKHTKTLKVKAFI